MELGHASERVGEAFGTQVEQRLHENVDGQRVVRRFRIAVI